MKTNRRVFLLAAALFVSFGASAHAATAKGRITGANVQNYRLLAVNRDSKSKVVSLTAQGRFSVPVKRGTTLHLISLSGRYFGPIVAWSGNKAFAALSGKGGDLGKFNLNTRGFAYAKLVRTNTTFFSNRPALPFNRVTGPRGAGKLGLVRSTGARNVSARDTAALGDDTDIDGIPDLLDVDDDGDEKLDVVDPISHTQVDFEAETFSTLRLSLTEPLNGNISTLDSATVEQRLKDNLILAFHVRNNSDGAKTLTAADIDCSDLAYCRSPDGTATFRMDNGPLPEGSPVVSYDPDGNGFPNMQIRPGGPSAAAINFRPHASQSDLRPGDTVIFKLQTSAGNMDIPGVLPFFFISSPTLVSYHDGAQSHAISYPVSPETDGTEFHPIRLAGDSITFTFWKPQRLPIEGVETAPYIDIGGLRYGISIGLETRVYSCLPSEYTSNSSALSIMSNGMGPDILTDSEADASADPARTLSYSVNLGACMRRQGVDPSGKTLLLALSASSASNDQTSQWVSVSLP